MIILIVITIFFQLTMNSGCTSLLSTWRKASELTKTSRADQPLNSFLPLSFAGKISAIQNDATTPLLGPEESRPSSEEKKGTREYSFGRLRGTGRRLTRLAQASLLLSATTMAKASLAVRRASRVDRRRSTIVPRRAPCLARSTLTRTRSITLRLMRCVFFLSVELGTGADGLV